MINDKQSLNYGDMSAALVDYKVRRKDKQYFSSSTTAEAMIVRGMGLNHRKDKGEFEKSKLVVVKI